MMFCKFVEKNLSAYLDGETGKLSSFIIYRHLTSCSACRKKLELFRVVSGLAKERAGVELSAEFMDNLRRRVGASGARPAVLRPVINFKLALTAFSLLIVLAGGLILSGIHENKQPDFNEYSTLAYQTKAEVVYSGTGVEYSTFSNQTGR